MPASYVAGLPDKVHLAGPATGNPAKQLSTGRATAINRATYTCIRLCIQGSALMGQHLRSLSVAVNTHVSPQHSLVTVEQGPFFLSLMHT